MWKNWVLLSFSYLCLACSETPEKQNFVFILVDDLGWTDVSYNGSNFYETPNIDALANESIEFTNAYAAASICSPSRAAILTGKHPARLNITDWIPGNDPKHKQLLGPQDLDELPLEEQTITEVLKNNGYHTFFAGKWHLGGIDFYPEDQGFEHNLGGHDKGSPPGGYYTPYQNPKLADGPPGEYLTDRLTNESIQFIEKNEGDPFFLFLSYYTVHTPIQANLKHIEYFKNKLAQLPKGKDSIRIEGGGITRLQQTNAAYASMVYTLDENIGKLIESLKKKELYEHTTIIFTSDNGGLSTLDTEYNRMAPTSVLPLRAGKGWLYEGGVRVPLLIKPVSFPRINKKNHSVVTGCDFYPTLLSLAGIQENSKHETDGRDISSSFDNDLPIPNRSVFWHYPHYHGSGWTPGASIRKGDWKLIEFHESNQVELYNLKEDLSEINDLSLQRPELVIQLKNELSAFQSSVQAQQAIKNPDYIIK